MIQRYLKVSLSCQHHRTYENAVAGLDVPGTRTSSQNARGKMLSTDNEDQDWSLSAIVGGKIEMSTAVPISPSFWE